MDKKKKKERLDNLEDLKKKEKTPKEEGSKEEKDMPTEEEVRAFLEITGLDIMKEQIATKEDIEGIHKKIDQILELIKEIVERLKAKKEKRTEPLKVKSIKKKVEILFLQGKKTEIQVPSSQKMREILDSQLQEGEVLNRMTSDVEIESIGTEKDWEIVDIIQETQEVQELVRKDKTEREKKKKEKRKRIEPGYQGP